MNAQTSLRPVFFLISMVLPLPAQVAHDVTRDQVRLERSNSLVTMTTGDSRPLHQAVSAICDEYGIAIDYEDPLYRSSDVVNASESYLKQYHLRLPIKLIKAHSFTAQFVESVDADRTLNDGESVLLIVLSSFNASGNPGIFHLQNESDGHLAVVGSVVGMMPSEGPTDAGILDSRVSIPNGPRNLYEMTKNVLAAVSAKSGFTVTLGSYPYTVLENTHVTDGGENIPARELLRRSLNQSGRTIRWFLLYDATLNQFVLNFQTVNRTIYDPSGKRDMIPVDVPLHVTTMPPE